MDDVQSDGTSQVVDSNGSVAPSAGLTSNSAGSICAWLIACCLCVGVLAVVAAHAPARVRLIGLFSIGFGLLVGWLTVLLTQVFEVRPARRSIVALASTLALAGFVASTWQTFQLDELTQKKTKEDELAALLMREFDRQAGVDTPDEMQLPPLNLGRLQRFRGYLSRRVRQLGEWPRPWPEVFWCGELLSASIAAGWIAQRLVSQSSRQQSQTGAVT